MVRLPVTRIAWLALVSLAVTLSTFVASAADPLKRPLIFRDDFENGADHWQPTDPAAWQVADTPEGKVYRLFGKSDFKPPHRSPYNFSLLRDVYVGDFALDAKVKSTVKDYGHRDMCIVFDYQDPAHFYYVHFGKQADDHANQIFIVNGADRKKISTESTSGTDWTDHWHHVRVVRKVESGDIEVFFDDLNKPVMRANDKTFEQGRVGLGSFDDLGEWDDVELRGKSLKP